MRQSTKASLFFLAVAMGLEIMSEKSANELRLFVGVFLVVALAFMIYSFQELSKREGLIVFEGEDPEFNNLIKPLNEEYIFQSDEVYLLMDNSVFINIKNKSPWRCFLIGIAATVGGQRLRSRKKKFCLFRPMRSIFVKKKDLYHLIGTDNVEILKQGDVAEYYDKETVAGVYFARIASVVLVVALVVYVLIQMFK